MARFSRFSSYPVTGSFSRSAVNNATGAQTQLAGLITALVMLCTLLWLTQLFNFLPDFVLAAIVISSVAPLVAYSEAIKLWRVKKPDFLLWAPRKVKKEASKMPLKAFETVQKTLRIS